MGYITEEGLENLKNYKYVSGGYSEVDKIMNPYWEFVVKLIPLVKSYFLMSFLVERGAKSDNLDRTPDQHVRSLHLFVL